MVKDPLDGGRTQELPFENVEMVETSVEPVPETEPEFKSTLSPEAKAFAEKALRARSFSERNRTLGKMINCQVCGQRHRENEKPNGQPGKCEQTFTYTTKDEDGKPIEYFREDPKTGTLVPYLRTAVDPELQPTIRQQVGAAAFAKRRHNPHIGGWKGQLVELTRKIFADMGFKETEGEQAQKNMAIARKAALRQMLNERRVKRIAKRNQSKLSRRINWGLANNGSRV